MCAACVDSKSDPTETPQDKVTACVLDPDVQGVAQAAGMEQLLFLAFWIGASIPCYMMCCCTKKPGYGGLEEKPAIGLAAMPPAGGRYHKGPGYVFGTPAKVAEAESSLLGSAV